MSRVFADSLFFIALLNPHDQHHNAAVERAVDLGGRLLTTHWVLVEVADALSDPPMRERVLTLVRHLGSDPNCEVLPPDQATAARGWDLYARRSDKAWSLTDCISFVVMSDRGLTEALTGDRHFERAGFRALLRKG